MQKNEDTRLKIIEVSSELFFTKGYEKTRITDIIERLNGLTKGAIYHYFDSKEDIFNTVVEQIGNKNLKIFDDIKNDKNLNGTQKLTKIVSASISNENMDKIIGISPNLLENPKLLAVFINKTINVTIPNYIYPIVQEGIEDGSINSKYDIELAELIATLLNIWLNPLIFNDKSSSMNYKIDIINNILSEFNIKLFDTEEE